MKTYLIVWPLVFLAGFVDSIAGGGGLISLPAYIIAGVPAHIAIGTNKMSSSMGTVISTARYLKNGYIKGRKLIILSICACVSALIGSVIGSRLSLLASDQILKNLMIPVLPIVAFYVLKNKNFGAGSEKGPLSDTATFAVAICASLVIGMYDGFYGPGTGTFLLIVLTGLARLDVQTASGMTKMINLSSNLAALTTFLIHGTASYSLGLSAGLFCIAGHYIGSGLVVHNGQKIVRPVVLVVLAILFIKILSGN